MNFTLCEENQEISQQPVHKLRHTRIASNLKFVLNRHIILENGTVEGRKDGAVEGMKDGGTQSRK